MGFYRFYNITIFNALQGYTKPREYIVTEWPLKQTCGEFWSLVYDHEASAVVVLCQPPHNSVSILERRLKCESKGLGWNPIKYDTIWYF